MTHRIAGGIVEYPPFMLYVEPTSVITRWPCGICGAQTEKHDELVQFDDEDNDWHAVCHECAQLDVDGIRDRLRRHAADLRAWADEIERRADQEWRMPANDEIREWLRRHTAPAGEAEGWF
jgi:hypothetical protein